MSEFAVALAALRADIPPITKRRTGQVQSRTYKYADYRSIKAKVDPVLAKHGFLWETRPTLVTYQDGIRFVLAYQLTHLESGQGKGGDFPLQEMDPQRQGSQISYAKRYALCAVLDLAPEGEDDDDGLAVSQLPEGRTKTKIPGPEHERLRHMDDAHGPTERGPAAEVDPWRDQPPGELPHEPEHNRGGIDGKQRSRIMRHLGNLSHVDRAARLANITGRDDIESTNDLTWAEAAEVIKILEES